MISYKDEKDYLLQQKAFETGLAYGKMLNNLTKLEIHLRVLSEVRGDLALPLNPKTQIRLVEALVWIEKELSK